MTMPKDSKIKLLNELLAAGSPFARDICADAASGIRAAIIDEAGIPLGEFAKRILRLYDPRAHVEVLDFENGHFDDLFVVASIAESARRLSGYERGILVVSSLERAGVPEGGRMSPKRKNAYSQNVDMIENYIMRYSQAFDNLEIFFI